MFTWDDGLVVHTVRERRVQITFSESRVHRETFDRSIFTPLRRFSFLFSPPIKICCCTRIRFPAMRCSPMHSPCMSSLSVRCYFLLMSLQSKVVDDIVYEVDCQLITVKEGDVDIGQLFPLIPCACFDLIKI